MLGSSAAIKSKNALAHADLNGDHQLQNSEIAPYGVDAAYRWKMIGTVESVTVATIGGKQVATLHKTDFKDNDLGVSIESARYPPPSPGTTGFTEINGTPFLANHASILCPQSGVQPLFCVGTPSAVVDVLTNIRRAEAMLNVQIQ